MKQSIQKPSVTMSANTVLCYRNGAELFYHRLRGIAWENHVYHYFIYNYMNHTKLLTLEGCHYRWRKVNAIFFFPMTMWKTFMFPFSEATCLCKIEKKVLSNYNIVLKKCPQLFIAENCIQYLISWAFEKLENCPQFHSLFCTENWIQSTDLETLISWYFKTRANCQTRQWHFIYNR